MTFKIALPGSSLCPIFTQKERLPFIAPFFFSYLCGELKKDIYMTIIVPTDFSNVANNAARYAAEMIKGQYDARLMLFHVYEKASEEKESGKVLEKLAADLQENFMVKVECRDEESGDLIDSLERLSRHMGAQLIVMGITGKSRLEKVFLGSNTLKMVERNICPVLIIPPYAQ